MIVISYMLVETTKANLTIHIMNGENHEGNLISLGNHSFPGDGKAGVIKLLFYIRLIDNHAIVCQMFILADEKSISSH